MPRTRRLLTLLPLLGLLAAVSAPAAGASAGQTAIFQDDNHILANPVATLTELRTLGVSEIRLSLFWSKVAPAAKPPRSFNASNPASYSNASWAPYDNAIRVAASKGIKVLLDVTSPMPAWADSKPFPGGQDPRFKQSWQPNTAQFGAFVKAVGTRYSGHYGGLPAVRNWSVWNEPNYGPSLSPQSRGSSVILAAAIYRSLLSHAWGALRASGHAHDTILFGEVAPHGRFSGRDFGGVAPLEFVRALYCVDGRFHQLRGGTARGNGCPTSASGSRRFRAQNPALFNASGFADHPYAQGTPPNRSLRVSGYDSADFADLAMVGKLESTLDRSFRAYGSRRKLSIWNTEYGFQTNPPEHSGGGNFPVSPDTAAVYMNWAEYISYKNSRIQSFDNYLLTDPISGQFASGLRFPDGSPKPGWFTYRMPLYLPRTSGRNLEIWGAVRPAKSTIYGPNQRAVMQFQPGGSGPFLNAKTFTVPRSGYFDFRWTFGRGGNVRVAWNGPAGVEFSRTIAVH